MVFYIRGEDVSCLWCNGAGCVVVVLVNGVVCVESGVERSWYGLTLCVQCDECDRRSVGMGYVYGVSYVFICSGWCR